MSKYNVKDIEPGAYFVFWTSEGKNRENLKDGPAIICRKLFGDEKTKLIFQPDFLVSSENFPWLSGYTKYIHRLEPLTYGLPTCGGLGENKSPSMDSTKSGAWANEKERMLYELQQERFRYEGTEQFGDYAVLRNVLNRAYDQAASGKGKERHADDRPFEEQPMQLIQQMFGTGFALGQAAKKAQESQRMDKDAAVRELLGAINYIAGAIVHLESDK